jgi:hypothetical protein
VIVDGDLTLTGSIAVGPDEFTGTATGTTPLRHGSGGLYFYSDRVIDPFALQGPSLTGTCSGHWLFGRGSEPSTAFRGPVAPPSPVAAISLSCTLQLGQAPPAETELVLALVNQSTDGSQHFSGAFGPGPSALAGVTPLSLGTADKYEEGLGGGTNIEYHLVGDIVLGGQVFHGDAGGGYLYQGQPNPTFSLTGRSPSGNLAATCTDTSVRAIGLTTVGTGLVCTGNVGSGPTGTVRILTALPLIRTTQMGRYSASDSSGVFVEYPAALPSPGLVPAL